MFRANSSLRRHALEKLAPRIDIERETGGTRSLQVDERACHWMLKELNQSGHQAAWSASKGEHYEGGDRLNNCMMHEGLASIQIWTQAVYLIVFLPPVCLLAYVILAVFEKDRDALRTTDKRVGPEDPLDERDRIQARAIGKSLQVDACTQTPDVVAVGSKITFGPVTQPIGGQGTGWIDKPCKCFHANPQKACTGGIPPDSGFPKHFVGLCAYNHNQSMRSSRGNGANVSKTNKKGATRSNVVRDQIKQGEKPVVYGPKTSN